MVWVVFKISDKIVWLDDEWIHWVEAKDELIETRTGDDEGEEIGDVVLFWHWDNVTKIAYNKMFIFW